MKKAVKKLVLAKETIRGLTISDADRVIAGIQPTFGWDTCLCPPTAYTCVAFTCTIDN